MDITTALQIAHLIGYADRGCLNCVGDLVEHANRMFPNFIFERTEHTEIDSSEYDEPDYKCEPLRIVVTVKYVDFPAPQAGQHL